MSFPAWWQIRLKAGDGGRGVLGIFFSYLLVVAWVSGRADGFFFSSHFSSPVTDSHGWCAFLGRHLKEAIIKCLLWVGEWEFWHMCGYLTIHGLYNH